MPGCEMSHSSGADQVERAGGTLRSRCGTPVAGANPLEQRVDLGTVGSQYGRPWGCRAQHTGRRVMQRNLAIRTVFLLIRERVEHDLCAQMVVLALASGVGAH